MTDSLLAMTLALHGRRAMAAQRGRAAHRAGSAAEARLDSLLGVSRDLKLAKGHPATEGKPDARRFIAPADVDRSGWIRVDNRLVPIAFDLKHEARANTYKHEVKKAHQLTWLADWASGGAPSGILLSTDTHWAWLPCPTLDVARELLAGVRILPTRAGRDVWPLATVIRDTGTPECILSLLQRVAQGSPTTVADR